MIVTGDTSAKIARFSLTTADARRLSRFYQNAFGCRIVETTHVGGRDFESLVGVEGGATKTKLWLGSQVIELLQFDKPGSPYPAESLASDLVFQHFAIVVSDMACEYGQLCAIPHWSPISIGGPQELPQSSGGVTAFKFRDPEGHPLELLAFPKGKVPAAWQKSASEIFLGIDHSAISISDIPTSLAFYRELGFELVARSMNEGPAQQQLDGLENVRVDVVSLSCCMAGPHLELLHYHTSSSQAARLRINDVAATCIIMGVGSRCSIDPDGHHILVD